MLSIQVSDTKNFMSHLLSGNTFDHFYFIEASIKMGVSHQIQGRINEGFYDTSVEQTLNRDFCYWKEVRNRIFDIIKGKRLPLSCKIVLGLPKQSVSYLISHSNSTFREDDIEGIYVNILYDPKTLLITTGISYDVNGIAQMDDPCKQRDFLPFFSKRSCTVCIFMVI